MTVIERSAKLARALELLVECGCTLERDSARQNLFRLILPESARHDFHCEAESLSTPSIGSGDKPGFENLTRQQTEVLLRISAAKPNKLIAYELGITETTVKAHVTNIYRRLGVRNRIEALLLIQRQQFAQEVNPGQF